MSSNYLNSLLEGVNQYRDRSQRRRGNINDILAMIQAPKPTGAPQVVGAGSAAPVGKSANGLHGEFDSALQRMIKDSGGKITLGSGYRSIAEQQRIYDLWKAGKHPAPKVAKPGSSNHNYGLAGDLKFADKATKAWAHANAAKYGLVFPMGDEPWHVELIGAKQKRGR